MEIKKAVEAVEKKTGIDLPTRRSKSLLQKKTSKRLRT